MINRGKRHLRADVGRHIESRRCEPVWLHAEDINHAAVVSMDWIPRLDVYHQTSCSNHGHLDTHRR